jgi:hypothetical protein
MQDRPTQIEKLDPHLIQIKSTCAMAGYNWPGMSPSNYRSIIKQVECRRSDINQVECRRSDAIENDSTQKIAAVLL